MSKWKHWQLHPKRHPGGHWDTIYWDVRDDRGGPKLVTKKDVQEMIAHMEELEDENEDLKLEMLVMGESNEA